MYGLDIKVNYNYQKLLSLMIVNVNEGTGELIEYINTHFGANFKN